MYWPDYPKVYDEEEDRWLTPWENYYKDLEEYGEQVADYNYEYLRKLTQ